MAKFQQRELPQMLTANITKSIEAKCEYGEI